ncbi:hypothetical protein Bbelb_336190 [Branchiostoma belcheri]|nr:hypothetical protein Bbelb_336190 [Branchiostoma belcheri]
MQALIQESGATLGPEIGGVLSQHVKPGYFARRGVYRPSNSFGGRQNSPRARLPRSSNLDRRAKGSCRPKNEFGTQGKGAGETEGTVGGDDALNAAAGRFCIISVRNRGGQ